jgi:four helix bundle protein
MFIALEISYRFLDKLIPIEARIRQRNASLGKQLGEAAESISLHLAEGRRRQDGDRRRHYEMAAGSASEVTTALEIARIKRYITGAELEMLDVELDQVRAILYRLTHRGTTRSKS